MESGKFPAWVGLNKKQFDAIRRSLDKRLKLRLKRYYVDFVKRFKFPSHCDTDLVQPGNKKGGLKVLKEEIRKPFKKVLQTVVED